LSLDEPGSFDEYLLSLRKARGMSAHSLSSTSGISSARLEALERGAGSPNRREIRQLATAFHLSAETMLVKAGQMRLILD